MNMKNTLPGGFANVHADIVSIGMESIIQNPFHLINHIKHVLPLILSQIEERSNMSSWDYECMSWGYRESIKE